MQSSFKLCALASIALAAMLGGAGADEPEGLYFMTRMWVGSIEMDAYYFEDGQVVRSPASDTADFDFDAARQVAPGQVGEVSMTSDTMTISWGDGAKSSSSLEPSSDGCFYFNGGLFCPVQPFSVSALEGTYSGGASGNSQLGYMQNHTSLTFSPDGRFSSSNTLGFSQDGAEMNVSGGGTNTSSGTYELEGTALTLSADSGENRTVTSFPFGEGDNTAGPEYIYFDGVMLARE